MPTPPTSTSDNTISVLDDDDDCYSVVKSPSTTTTTNHRLIVASLMLSLSIASTANAIAGKIRAEPLQEYSGFVTSIISQIMYGTVYWIILGVKVYFKRVSMSEIRYVWKRPTTTLPMVQSHYHQQQEGGEASKCKAIIKIFTMKLKRWWTNLPGMKYALLASICDVFGEIFMFMSQPYLSIVIFNLLQQGMVPFTLLFSMIILASRYIAQEVFGVLLVISMAIVSVVVGAVTMANNDQDGEITSSSSLTTSNSVLITMSIICLLATLFQALSFVLKECMFREYSRQHASHNDDDNKEARLDIFAVSSASNFFGMIWVLPISLLVESFRTSLPILEHIGNGFNALSTVPGAWQSLLVYLTINLLFNINIYLLVSYGSTLLTFVCMKVTVPLAALLSMISWPLIGSATISWLEWVTLIITLIGIAIFRHGNIVRERLQQQQQQQQNKNNNMLNNDETAAAATSSSSSITPVIICMWPFFRVRSSTDTSTTTSTTI